MKKLESFINNFFKQHNTNVVYSTKNKLNNIIKLGKDKTKTRYNVHVVYKINCKDCNASYVGQTGRRLNVRIKEHTKEYNMQDENSSLYIHTIDNNHRIDLSNKVPRWRSSILFTHVQITSYSLRVSETKSRHLATLLSNIKILDTESNRGKRLFSEALFIHTQTNYMNKQYEINKLAKDYTPLINNCDFMRLK